MPSLLLPTPAPKGRLVRLAVVLVAALCVHAVMLGLVVLSSVVLPSSTPPPKKPTVSASLRRIDARTWAANRGSRAPSPLERPMPLPKGQVVDVAPGNDRVPQDSKYLAETNNTVQRETRAREQTSKYSVAAPKNAPNPERAPAAKGVTPRTVTPPPEKSGIDLAESMLGRQRPPPSLFPSTLPQTQGDDEVRGREGTESGSTSSAGDATEGGGAPNDALDAPEGDGTFLNTREFRYASFFNRVKQAVSAKWDPNGRLRARNRTLGALDRTTVLVVVLRPDGSMADCYVQKSSGLEDLDVEAMNAFQRAAPFSNPPAALVKDGVIAFQFSFLVSNEQLMIPPPVRFR